MARSKFLALTFSLLAAVAFSNAVRADMAEAMCEVRKDGESKKNASGPCTFSQRQGYVNIDLRNGDKYSLRPTDKANHYKDDKGNQVVRKATGDTHEYKWPNKRIIVTFTGGATSAAPAAVSAPNGQTPSNLRDVVGKPASSAEGMMSARGYDFYKSSVSGADVYGSWKHRTTGQCVMVHQVHGNFESIVTTGPGDCQ